MRDLDTRVLTALRWTALARFSGQLISWAATIIVIRLVAPGDYGLMAVAAAVMSLLILLNTLGLDAVLIQERNLDAELKRRIFGLVIVLNLVLLAATVAGAPLLADFFGQPRLTPVLRVMALQFAFLIFETMPQTALERELDFRKKSLVDLATLVLGSVGSLLFALAGAGVWALVFGNLITVATRVAGLNIIAPFRAPPSFSLRGLRPHLKFGSSVTSERGLWVAYSEADKFIGGKMMSQESLGFYAVAMHIASLPIAKLSALLNSVAFPAFSQVQDQRERVGNLVVKGVRLLSFGAFPVFFGIASLAPEIVPVLLGEKWQAAALPMQIGALIMPLRMLGNFMSSFVWALGQPQVSAGNLLLAAIVMPASFVVGARFGPLGLAIAWLAAYPIVFVISLVRALRVAELGWRRFLAAAVRPALAAGVMFLVVAALRTALLATPALPRMAILLAAGAAVYIVLTLIVDRGTWRELVDIARSKREPA